MHLISKSSRDGTVKDFLVGFCLATAIVVAFGLGVEVGAASSGASIDLLDVAPMIGGGVTAIFGLIYLQYNY